MGSVPKLARIARERMLPFVLVAGFGLALGACSKCDVPTWQHSDSGTAPLACHDEAPPR